MRRVVFLTGLALAVGALVPASALPAAGGSDLPFRGSQSGTGTVNFVTLQSHVVTSGTFSHCGLTTAVQDFQLAPTGPGAFNFVGTWTATAANGDQMFGTSTGTSTFTDSTHVTSVGSYTSSGGTGRFADATLTFVATVHSTQLSVAGGIATNFFEATAVGQLSYR